MLTNFFFIILIKLRNLEITLRYKINFGSLYPTIGAVEVQKQEFTSKREADR